MKILKITANGTTSSNLMATVATNYTAEILHMQKKDETIFMVLKCADDMSYEIIKSIMQTDAAIITNIEQKDADYDSGDKKGGKANKEDFPAWK